ncbi:DUF445 domain-containing protein [Stutzerimonas tarimensis]|uniref:DUF445 domain-containing protein n=1 Tax=Stutzerimonas tarimensis TaxID=1507735 RepID=A0ABV7T5G7_9GAMM
MLNLATPLGRMKAIALGLLLLAAALYVVGTALVEIHHPGWSWLVAFAEAAMIGAIADWFAVTALFRHPLGLPIPHTAIIPRNKKRIGDNLAEFICTHFLTTAQVLEKIREFDAAGRLAVWLARPEHAERVGRQAVAVSAHLVGALRDERAAAFIERSAKKRLAQIDLAPLTGQVLGLLTADKRHQQVLDELLRLFDRTLRSEQMQQRIAAILAEELGKLLRIRKLGEMAGDWSTERLVQRLSEVLGEVSHDPEHPLRRRFDDYLARFIEQLKADPEFQRKGQELRDQLLKDPALTGYLGGLWDDLVDWLQADLARPDSSIGRRIAEVAGTLGAALKRDEAMRNWLNDQLLAAAPPLIERYRADIGRYIAARVEGWNTGELVEQIEANIGKDLQYIRVNGTLVGGMVGLVIHGLTLLALGG